MSENTTPNRKAGTRPEVTPSDMFVMRFANPHTAIPDWLILTRAIRQEVRHMATVIIILSKRGVPPTKDEIAEVLGVEQRTVQRWLAELRAAGCMSYQLVGKRRMYVFHEPSTITDRGITDLGITDPHAITDRGITDRGVSHDDESRSAIHPQRHYMNDGKTENRITDRSGGGGGSDSPEAMDPPTTAARRRTKVLPGEIVTETGRWMVREGFNVASAYRFQALPLTVAQADYARRRELGQRHGAVVQAWMVELPEFDHLSEQPAAAISESRRAELQAKYGDLFLFSGDMPAPEQDDE